MCLGLVVDVFCMEKDICKVPLCALLAKSLGDARLAIFPNWFRWYCLRDKGLF